MKTNKNILNSKITFLLISLTILAYLAKIVINPESSNIQFVNILLTTVNLALLFSTNGFEKLFKRDFWRFLSGLIAIILIFIGFLKGLPDYNDTILNIISALSIIGTFIQNDKKLT